ncbi:glycoside hydrolase family 44 protein [Ruminococcus flavefaciens]|uniref:glycoside hydrolase family 44 protein n=1 Tax=Ruminococcus flavefaciens TaxID=1265 RepID=UPI0026EA892F|nr:glycoside hydrolase family 44 protein [Ruminococcus flavefaciens]MDD7518105.1 glycoside hydrolase family 44 protein [Ruminococcus flavefaciens]MDY5690283.1 glycoside hydrolase family 44 protein [Ruminococcus flavefaciens]
MKKTAAFLAACVVSGCAVTAPMTSIPHNTAYAAGGYDMSITVDLKGERKEISPLIYGVNQYTTSLKDVKTYSVRQGGNRMTAYNWETNASNAGSDWKHSSDTNLSESDDPADCVQGLSKDAAKNNVGYKLTTLQLAGYVSADKDGTVTEEEKAPSKRWNKVVLTKDAPFADTPDLTDGVVYMDEYVNYIINKLGDSKSATGIQGYSLDNEPVLWNDTHSRMHPEPVTIKELGEKSIEMAKNVKKLDPNAEVFGPALYGYTAFDHLDDDDDHTEWEEVKAANNYHWYLDCYLDQMHKASEESGTRLLDVLDIHYYSESARNGIDDRLQSVRTLYEKGFSENSWIGQWCMQNVPILPTIQASIDKYYPGTKLGISEYNFGGGNDASGTIAEAEALGCYADQGVYFASLWGGEPFIVAGINLYTNYDGKGGSFGDTLVPAKSEDVSKSSTYAAVNSKDDSQVTVMVTNKDLKENENAVINLKNTDKQYKSAAVYAIYGDDEQIKLIDVVKDVKDNNVKVELPAFSAAMVVVSDKADAFDDLKTYEETKTETVTKDFTDIASMTNDKGYIIVPIEDAKHLSKIVINGDVTSTAGSGWATAGCAVCINAVSDAGENFWTYKSYNLTLGSSTATVKFDGILNKETGEGADKVVEELKATVADGKVELQKWWDASEKGESDTGDTIGVDYKSIQVVYEYPQGEAPASTTTTTSAVTTTSKTTTSTVTSKTVTTSDKPADVKYGDANCDGDVDLSDAVLIMQSLANPDKYGTSGSDKSHLTKQGSLNGDCCNNGNGITVNDAVSIQRYLLKLIPSLPEKAEEK